MKEESTICRLLLFSDCAGLGTGVLPCTSFPPGSWVATGGRAGWLARMSFIVVLWNQYAVEVDKNGFILGVKGPFLGWPKIAFSGK